jgi:hypothetical protein
MCAAPLELVMRGEGGSFELRRLDPGMTWLQMRPRPCEAQLTEVDGHWVLTTPDRRVYLRLSLEERHLWGLVDGRASVAEIATSYFVTFGALPVSRVAGFMQTLRSAGLVEVEPAGFLRKRFKHVAWLRRELTWTGAHAVAERIWRALGPMLTAWNLPVAVGIVAMGAYAFHVDQRIDPTPLAAQAPMLALAAVVHLVLHELAHAVAVVGFGRKVRGVAIGLQGAYVDTTDMYLGTRSQHAVVAMAGPGTSLFLTAVAAVVACALPLEWVTLPRAFMAVGAVATFLGGWPFLFDNDAVHALGDVSGTPHVRASTWTALRTGALRPVHLFYLAGSVLTVLAPPVFMLLRS